MQLRGRDGALVRTPEGAPVAGSGFSFVPTRRLLGRLPTRIVIAASEDAARDLRGSIKVTRLRDTNLLQIACTDADPQLAAAVPNVTASVYRSFSAVRARRAATLRREFLAGQVAQITDSLMAAQQVLADYQARSKTLDPRTEGEALGEASRAAQTDLRTLRFKESVLQSLVHALQTPGNSDEAVRRLVAVSQDLIPAGPELYRKLQGFETERGRLTASRYGYTRQGPGVDALDSLIADTKQEMRQVAEQSLGLLRAQLASAEQRVNELNVREGMLPEQATEFARLKQRADAVEKTFDLLSSKYYEAQTAEAMEGGSVDIAEAAIAPTRPDPRHLGRTLLLALALGVIVGVFAAFALESLDGSIRRVGDAEEVTGMDVIGWIPDSHLRREIPGRSGRGEVRAAALSEAFRSLRTNLRFARTERPRVIAVTSAGPAEGKSTIAENLATTLSHAGASVLLVDADLHRPVMHSRYTLDRSPGLSDVLVGEANLAQAIQDVGEGLSVLPCGTAAPRPGDLLQSSVFADLMRTAREAYTWVVVDTPPILAVSDATSIGMVADGVLLVARVRSTNRHALGQACRLLARCGASSLGLVLNGVPTSRGYGRYSGPGSYYAYSVYGDYSSSSNGQSPAAGSPRLHRLSRRGEGKREESERV